MAREPKLELIRQMMGASHVYGSAVDDLLERALAASTGEQLAMSQVKLLVLVSTPGHRFKVSDVADFMGVTNAAASRAIDRLVQRGLVDRRVSTVDRRAVDLSLTDAGRVLLERFEAERNRELLRLLGDVPDDTLRRLVELLDDLSVRLLDIEAPGERCLRCGIHFREGCVVRDVLGRECIVAAGLHGDTEEEESPAG